MQPHVNLNMVDNTGNMHSCNRTSTKFNFSTREPEHNKTLINLTMISTKQLVSLFCNARRPNVV